MGFCKYLGEVERCLICRWMIPVLADRKEYGQCVRRVPIVRSFIFPGANAIISHGHDEAPGGSGPLCPPLFSQLGQCSPGEIPVLFPERRDQSENFPSFLAVVCFELPFSQWRIPADRFLSGGDVGSSHWQDENGLRRTATFLSQHLSCQLDQE